MELETRRLLLRPLRDEDAPAMTLGCSNLNVSRNLARVSYPYTLEQAHDFINLQSTFDPRTNICAITFKCAPEELLGVIGYEYGIRKDEVIFGYWLRECCWNLRIMSEATTALVSHAFTKAEQPTMASGYHLDNPNSGRILYRLGFEDTHQEMNFSLAQNKEVPTMRLRLTREAWERRSGS